MLPPGEERRRKPAQSKRGDTALLPQRFHALVESDVGAALGAETVCQARAGRSLTRRRRHSGGAEQLIRCGSRF